jgi:hypothetical protein
MTPDGGVYHYGETDGSGEITFAINPSGENTLHVTSTAPDHLPYEGSALIEGGSAGIPTGDPSGAETAFHLTGNPVVGGTTFRFSLRDPGPVRIEVFDVSGRLVDEIVNRPYDSGIHAVGWEVSGSARRQIAPGIYFVTFSTGEYAVTRQAVLLR